LSREAEKLYSLTHIKFTPLEAYSATPLGCLFSTPFFFIAFLPESICYIISYMNSLPTLKHEIELWKKGYIVIGVDEVGRGAFAGPLYVGGVVFLPTTNNKRITKLLSYGMNDSKKIKPRLRESLSKIIQRESFTHYVSTISVTRINSLGVGAATFLGIRDVVKNIRETLKGLNYPRKVFVLIDKFYVRYLHGIGLKNQQGIVGGDGISLSIAAASIIAKVARDNHMRRLSAKFPAYGWGRNKGYGTNMHRFALQKFGATSLHRKDFIENFVWS